jgi:hypothetical protein
MDSANTSASNYESSSAPTGFTDSLKITVGTADTSLASTDRYSIYQYIEGNNVADLDFGMATAKTVTVSFWTKSSVVGTYGVYLMNGSYNRGIPSTFTINVANTWEYKTITFAGDITGTWFKDNRFGLALGVSFAMGTTYQGTANTWTASAVFTTSSQTNFMATSGNTFYITGVQLEKGTTASSFEFRSYGKELMLCQRYYEKSYNIDVAVPTATYVANNFEDTWGSTASRPLWDINFAVWKRANPSMVFYSPNSTTPGKCGGPSAADFNCTSNGSYHHNFQCYQSSGNSSATAGADYYLQWSASAEL